MIANFAMLKNAEWFLRVMIIGALVLAGLKAVQGTITAYRERRDWDDW